jgi:hypothetical protein
MAAMTISIICGVVVVRVVIGTWVNNLIGQINRRDRHIRHLEKQGQRDTEVICALLPLLEANNMEDLRRWQRAAHEKFHGTPWPYVGRP